MRIRKVGPEEAGLLAQMDQCCFSDNWKKEDWSSFLSMSQYDCCIAEEDNMSRGFLLTSTAADEGEVLKIGVLPDFRKNNLGILMLNKAFEEWKTAGVRSVFLEVRESNQPAQGLYKKQGFEKAGIRKNYYKNPAEHAVVYVRKI
ncbi:MAG: ribosomal protein S18-alanine N-acetyltransferase [Lachnospiraceae bacterium]|nr:ribosomal protein S18-alanine N-acetyltransferase [Lachnospiraceae bacterium]